MRTREDASPGCRARAPSSRCSRSPACASSFMFTLVVPIQAKLPELLDASREDTAWVVTSTLLVAAVFTPIVGRLGDMYGKRRIVLVLLALLVVGSVIAALSPGLIGVIVGRALQGAVVGVVPLGIAILRDVLHEDRVDTAIALISATLGVGGALGLPISAFVTEFAATGTCCSGSPPVSASSCFAPRAVDRPGERAAHRRAASTSSARPASRSGSSASCSRSRAATSGAGRRRRCSRLGLGGIVVLLRVGLVRAADRRAAARPARRRAAGRCCSRTSRRSAMGFSLFASNVVYPQMLELPVETGAGFGLSLIAASLIVMPAGLVMMVLSPVSGRLARVIGPKLLLHHGRGRARRRVRLHAAVLRQRGVADLRLEHPHRRRHRLRLRGDADAHHALGAAERDGRVERAQRAVPLPRHEHRGGRHRRGARHVLGRLRAACRCRRRPAFTSRSSSAGAAALIALVVALFIPAQRAPQERHPSLPE